MVDKIEVGIIGMGKMGLLHGAIFNRLDGCRLSAICDTKEYILKIVKNGRDKVRTFTDYRAMLDMADLDVVAITTPVFLHEPMAAAALRAGKHVLIEKPLAKKTDECSRLVDLSNSTKNLVGYCRRFMPTYREARELMHNEALGELISFNSHCLLTQVEKKGTGWQFDPIMSGGGALMDLGCHAIDLVHYVLGPVDSVSCTVEKVISEAVEDMATLQLTLRTGVNGQLDVSWTRQGYRLPEVLLGIQCERGAIRVTEKYLETMDKDGRVETRYKQTFNDPIPLNIGGREYTAEDVDLIQSIRNDTETGCNIHTGSMPNCVIDSAYTSARSGQEENVFYL